MEKAEPRATDARRRTCPSARCEENAVLLGIVGPDGTVAYLSPRVTVSRPFVDEAQRGRMPEARFRFAQPCLESGCANWVDDRCDVIDAALRSPRLWAERGETLPRCGIRATCRWFAQWSASACAVCPRVVHSPDG